MTGMNRLSPLIVRRASRDRPVAVAMSFAATQRFAGAEPARWLEDLKLFATGWIGGLIFFGTLFS